MSDFCFPFVYISVEWNKRRTWLLRYLITRKKLSYWRTCRRFVSTQHILWN